jgi:hypothetical protein
LDDDANEEDAAFLREVDMVVGGFLLASVRPPLSLQLPQSINLFRIPSASLKAGSKITDLEGDHISSVRR